MRNALNISPNLEPEIFVFANRAWRFILHEEGGPNKNNRQDSGCDIK
jgi:hypothetical protein